MKVTYRGLEIMQWVLLDTQSLFLVGLTHHLYH